MSFINSDKTAKVYAPGYFVAIDDENIIRETRTIAQASATTAADGTKYVPMGTIYPSNDTNAEGIVYEDVDVTSGDMPGSVVLKAVVYEDKLPEILDSDARTALEGKGFTFISSTPTVTRPY